MNANEARQKAQNNLKKSATNGPLNHVRRRIAEATEKGEFSLSFPFYEYEGNVTSAQEEVVYNVLRGEGYKVEYHEGDYSDPRECSYHEIKW